LLAHIAGVTQQQSLRANRALVLHNARVAAEVAAQLVGFLPQDAY
jgi:pseudouridine-5'-phosphate glycosidase